MRAVAFSVVIYYYYSGALLLCKVCVRGKYSVIMIKYWSFVSLWPWHANITSAAKHFSPARWDTKAPAGKSWQSALSPGGTKTLAKSFPLQSRPFGLRMLSVYFIMMTPPLPLPEPRTYLDQIFTIWPCSVSSGKIKGSVGFSLPC